MPRLEPNCLAEAGNRFVESRLLDEDDAQIAVYFCKVRTVAKCFAKELDRQVAPLRLKGDQAKQVQGIDQARIGQEYGTTELFGLLGVARLVALPRVRQHFRIRRHECCAIKG